MRAPHARVLINECRERAAQVFSLDTASELAQTWQSPLFPIILSIEKICACLALVLVSSRVRSHRLIACGILCRACAVAVVYYVMQMRTLLTLGRPSLYRPTAEGIARSGKTSS